jgi:selenocysteine-specific elongation factor
MAAEALARLGAATRAALEDFHRRQPLRGALGREELKSRVFAHAAEGALERVLAELAAEGSIRVGPDGVASAGHSVRLSAGEESAREALLQGALAGGYRGLEDAGALPGHDRGALERMARLLVGSGELQRLGDGLLLHRQRLDELKAEIRQRWPPGSRLDVAGFKDLTGLSRKYVIPLLEFMDRERVTRRSGNDRVVLA